MAFISTCLMVCRKRLPTVAVHGLTLAASSSTLHVAKLPAATQLGYSGMLLINTLHYHGDGAAAALAGVGTPEQTYGVACTVFPGNKKDLHGTPWLVKPRKRVAPVTASAALAVNAKCYSYTTQADENVSSIVETFNVDYRDFIHRNRRQFGSLQDVTYRLGQNKKATELQRILEVVSSVTKDLTPERPYFTCTFYDKNGVASNRTCYIGATQACAENGTVSCALRYKDVNVTQVLPPRECVFGTH